MRLLSSLASLASAVALALMALIVFVEIAMRLFLGNTWQLSPEFAGYALVATTFLGMCGAYWNNQLMRIEVLYDRWSPTTRRFMSIIFEAASLAATAIAAWYSWGFAYTSFKRGTIAPTLYSTPIWVPQMLIPIGLALLSIAILVRLVRTIRGAGES